MQIIDTIKKYKDKYGNTQIIDRYYELHGTYNGIIEQLNDSEKQDCEKPYKIISKNDALIF